MPLDGLESLIPLQPRSQTLEMDASHCARAIAW